MMKREGIGGARNLVAHGSPRSASGRGYRSAASVRCARVVGGPFAAFNADERAYRRIAGNRIVKSRWWRPSFVAGRGDGARCEGQRGVDGDSIVESVGLGLVARRGNGFARRRGCARTKFIEREFRSRHDRVSADRHARLRSVCILSYQRPFQDDADGVLRLPQRYDRAWRDIAP
jgi:hypothetical protein